VWGLLKSWRSPRKESAKEWCKLNCRKKKEVSNGCTVVCDNGSVMAPVPRGTINILPAYLVVFPCGMS